MPISPQQIADKRLENTVNKLCDLIDKKLMESEDTPFQFNFLPSTSPQVQAAIVDIYRKAGWSVAQTITEDSQNSILILDLPRSVSKPSSERDWSIKIKDPAKNPESFTNNPEALKAKAREAQAKLKNDAMTGAQVRTKMLEDAINSEEGHFALAMAMSEPIDTTLMYQSPTRKLFMSDELGANKPIYSIDYGTKPIYHSKDGTIKPYDHACIDDITVLMAQTDIEEEELVQRKFYIIDRAQSRLGESLDKQEEAVMVKLFQAAAVFDQTIYTYAETVQRAILDSIGEIESDRLIAAKLIMHPRLYRRLMFQKMYIDEMGEATQRDILMTGLYGHLYTMDIHVNTYIPDNEIFITPPAQFLGAWALPKRTEVLPSRGKDGEFGFLAKVECFPVLLHPELVRKVVVRF